METQSLTRVSHSPGRARQSHGPRPGDARAARIGDGVFRPEIFFVGRTEGAGAVRNALGRITRRCAISTDGEYSPTYGAIHYDQLFTYDDGRIDTWRWVMTPGRDGRYVAAEAAVGSGIAGEIRGMDCWFVFRRPIGAIGRLVRRRYAVRFTLLSADTAMMRVKVSLLGLPVAEMTAVHRRVG